MAFAEEKGLQLMRTYRTSWPKKIDGVGAYFEALVNTVLLERMRDYVQVSFTGFFENFCMWIRLPGFFFEIVTSSVYLFSS